MSIDLIRWKIQIPSLCLYFLVAGIFCTIKRQIFFHFRYQFTVPYEVIELIFFKTKKKYVNTIHVHGCRVQKDHGFLSKTVLSYRRFLICFYFLSNLSFWNYLSVLLLYFCFLVEALLYFLETNDPADWIRVFVHNTGDSFNFIVV